MYKSTTVELQQLCNGSYRITVVNHFWTNNPIKDIDNAEIAYSICKEHTGVTQASYVRFSKLLSEYVNKGQGRITPWHNSPGSWSYMPNLESYKEVNLKKL